MTTEPSIRIAGVTIAGSSERPMAIDIRDGRVTGVGSSGDGPADGPGAADRTFDAAGLLALPGFIELQVNGAAGHDLTSNPESLWEVGLALARYGITSFLPTLVSPAFGVIDRARAAFLAGPPAGYAGATALGWHVEGPFLSPARAGAHEPIALRLPDPGVVAGWSATTGIRLVTLAPELPHALEVVERLVGSGVVVSAGHSTATYREAIAGFDAGIRSVTHLFNAMRPLDHREPGLAGAAMERESITVGLIPDGIHVHPAIVAVTRRAVGPERLAIVTDAIAALGMPSGRHRLANRQVDVDERSARLPDGVLAGSVLGMDAGIRNLAAFSGCTVAEAVVAATAVPASLLGELDRGSIRVGGVADVTLVTPDFEVVLTVAGGRVAFTAPDEAGGGRWA
jgi:N-acetylglucosamine-6-phosphate deacetylase